MFSKQKYCIWLSTFGIFLTDAAIACSSCNTGDSAKASQDAYLFITFLMGGIPMLALAVFCLWYYWKSRRLR